MRPRAVARNQQTRGVTALGRRHAHNKGHNHRDLNYLRSPSPGMRVNIRFINFTNIAFKKRKEERKRKVPQWHIYILLISSTFGDSGV